MAKNTPGATTPLWWTFFYDSTLDGREDIVPVCKVFGPNANRATEKWDSGWANVTGTTAERVGKRWATQIQYCVNTLGCTSNLQLCIQLQFGGDELLVKYESDGLGLTAGTTDKNDWDNSTVFTDDARAYFTSLYAGAFATLESQLVSMGITQRPAFFIQDVEDFIIPYRWCGGNSNGNYNDGTVSGGNWGDQTGDVRSTTITGDIVLHAGTASKGGATDRTLDDLTITAAGDIDADWRQSGQIGFSRDAWALSEMVMDSALSRVLYDAARAVFTTSYTGSVPIKCGNYRVMCADRTPYPHRHRNSYSAPDGTDLDTYAAPAYVTDFYGDVQSPVLYPCREFFERSEGATYETDDENFFTFTGHDTRAMGRNYYRSQIQAARKSSEYVADLTVPWMQWPNIGRGGDHGGTLANGDVFDHHPEDFEWQISALLRHGIYRGFIWSWNPVNQAAADSTVLMARLDAAYARQGHAGGVS